MTAPNRLAQETSPYLRQHADNPVDWYPWGPEAFDEARRRGVPVLLSVGYSACHWCHVMAHESFEDPATAEVLNELFVSVKVDREERPDIDAIYLEAVQTQTGHGGWPMTVFLTPDGKPFYCGTYYPPQPRHGLPAFVELCRAIHDAWTNRRDEIDAHATELAASLGRDIALGIPAAEATGMGLNGAVDRLVAQFDPEWGGFGGAPKFPQAMALDFLLRCHVRTGSPAALEVACTTLDAMAGGGIYDHLDGGFARYSTDREWLVPHFEKMLYDNALLVRVYLHAWQVTGEARYRQVVEETVGYVLGRLTRPGGGWASAEDADSEGEEGRFYVWSASEITEVVGHDADEVRSWYGVTEAGNFEGHNILNCRDHRRDLLRPPEVEVARQRLAAVRDERVRPGLDDKCLTEWNALMLSSLAEAAVALRRDDWLEAARVNGTFLLSQLRRADGRWLRSWQTESGPSPVPAFAADHAALVDAFVRLGEASGEARWIDAAVYTADALLSLFWDDVNGGLFTTGRDAEVLVARPKEIMDNAVPSADSTAASGLRRLAALTGENRYRAAADAIVARTGSLALEHPTGFGQLLVAMDLAADDRPLTEVVVTGNRPDLLEVVRSRWRPLVVLAWGEPFASPLWSQRPPGFAYVCEGGACRMPAGDPDALAAQLASRDVR